MVIRPIPTNQPGVTTWPRSRPPAMPDGRVVADDVGRAGQRSLRRNDAAASAQTIAIHTAAHTR